jgi:hypothetical protein
MVILSEDAAFDIQRVARRNGALSDVLLVGIVSQHHALDKNQKTALSLRIQLLATALFQRIHCSSHPHCTACNTDGAAQRFQSLRRVATEAETVERRHARVVQAAGDT